MRDVRLSEKQCRVIVKELCDVLILLHGKGIIHRDIKPSNILLAKDGHIRLIDFDAARIMKEDSEQDTMLLGTRGYVPPEQYGFSQTDERADIYALGVTIRQLLGDKAEKFRYRRILSKCTNLDPSKRYQSICQVRKTFFYLRESIFCTGAAVVMAILLWNVVSDRILPQEGALAESTELIALPAPEGLYWATRDTDEARLYFGCITNWEDYGYNDWFDVYVYDASGEYIMNNRLKKKFIMDRGAGC